VLRFLSSHPNWDPPTPETVGECVPPLVPGGGTHLLTGEGVNGVQIQGDRHWGILGISHVTSFISPIDGPNISVRLAYFHPNRLLTGLYKQELEIL
jgi:hypothetical protein